MPQVIFSTTALRDLERLREFLRPKNSVATKRTALVIIKAVQVLALYPQIGKPSEVLDPECRELPIGFGDGGYIAFVLLRWANCCHCCCAPPKRIRFFDLVPTHSWVYRELILCIVRYAKWATQN